MKFKIFGTEIQVTFLFTALLCLMLLTDKSGFFLPSLIAVILHETAHLAAMWVLGCSPKAVKLIPASVQIVRDISSRVKNEILISLFGPLINLLLFAVFLGVYKLTANMNILTFSLINLIFALFNLLPVRGLDGGLILYKILENKLNRNKAEIVLNVTTVTIAVAALIFGIVTVVNGTVNFSLIILSIYLIISVLIKF